jgi:hypothetical protein
MEKDGEPIVQTRIQTTSFLVPIQGKEIPATMAKGQTVTIPEHAVQMPAQLRGEWGIHASRLVETDDGLAVELDLRRELRITRSKAEAD